MAAEGNETEVAALYRLPVAEFVAARDQLAKRLRLAGDPGAARTLRRATAQQRAVVAQLVQRAETLLARAGHAASDQTLARVAATLQAAATGDAATRAALAEGRLQGDLDPAGFGFAGALDPAADAADGPPAAAAEPAAAEPGAAPAGGARRAAARQAAMRTLRRPRPAPPQ